MKKIISVILSLIIIAASLLIGFSAYAAEAAVKYDSQKKQFNAQATTFNYDGDKTVKLLYDTKTKKYKVFYSEELSKKGTAIFTLKSYTNLAIKGNYVFYYDTARGGIYRRKLTGKGEKKIISFTKNKFSDIRFILCGSRLIYNLMQYDSKGNFLASKLYSATTKGENKKRLAKNVESEMYMYKNMLYFIKGNALMRYNFNDGTLKNRYVGLQNFKNAHLANMENNILYIAYLKGAEYNNQCNYYKVDVDKQKYWRFEGVSKGNPVHSALVYEGRPYAITGSSKGCEFASVVGEAYNYKAFKSLYKVGGENLGYYKNNIILDNFTLDSKTGKYKFNKYVIMVKK